MSTAPLSPAPTMELAQKLYDKNLSMLLEKVRQNRRGVYRVMMDDTGLILSITPCRPGKPQPDCFSLIVPGNAAPPKFGAFSSLSGILPRMAHLLEQDVLKVLRTNEAAYALKNGKSPVLDRMVQGRVDELVKRFGLLPEPALQREEAKLRERQIRARLDEEEKQQIWNDAAPDFETLLQRELSIERQREEALLAKASKKRTTSASSPRAAPLRAP